MPKQPCFQHRLHHDRRPTIGRWFPFFFPACPRKGRCRALRTQKRERVSAWNKKSVDPPLKHGEDLVGVYRGHRQTIDAALTLKHPVDAAFPLPDILLRSICRVLSLGPNKIAERRVGRCAKNMAFRKKQEKNAQALLWERLWGIFALAIGEDPVFVGSPACAP